MSCSNPQPLTLTTHDKIYLITHLTKDSMIGFFKSLFKSSVTHPSIIYQAKNHLSIYLTKDSVMEGLFKSLFRLTYKIKTTQYIAK